MARKVSLKSLIAASTAAVATFGDATNDFRVAQRNASIATVNAIIAGEDAETAIARAKEAYGYDAKDSKGRGTFRQWATDVRTVAAGYAALSDDDKAAFQSGEKPASTVASAINKPERDAKKAAKAAEKEAAEQKAEREAAANAPRVITPAEMGVHFAGWLDSLGPKAKLSKAQQGAIGAVLESLAAYRDRVAGDVVNAVAKAA